MVVETIPDRLLNPRGSSASASLECCSVSRPGLSQQACTELDHPLPALVSLDPKAGFVGFQCFQRASK